MSRWGPPGTSGSNHLISQRIRGRSSELRRDHVMLGTSRFRVRDDGTGDERPAVALLLIQIGILDRPLDTFFFELRHDHTLPATGADGVAEFGFGVSAEVSLHLVPIILVVADAFAVRADGQE